MSFYLNPAIATRNFYFSNADVSMGGNLTLSQNATINGTIYGTAPYGCKVHRTTAQSINHATWTNLYFNTDIKDDYGLHSTSTNTDRIYVYKSGWYDINAHVLWNVSTSGVRILLLYKYDVSAGSLMQIADNRINATGWDGMEATATTWLDSGDYIYVRVYQDTGGSLNLLGDNSEHTSSVTVFRKA
jgi:hypothetical protein